MHRIICDYLVICDVCILLFVESWIDFTRTQATGTVQTEVPSGELATSSSSPVKMTPVSSKTLEKLLLEAQRESSYASSRIDSLTSSRAR